MFCDKSFLIFKTRIKSSLSQEVNEVSETNGMVDVFLIRMWIDNIDKEVKQEIWKFLYGYDTNEFLCQDSGYIRKNSGMKLSRNCFIIPENHFLTVKTFFTERSVKFDILGGVKTEHAGRYIVSYERMAFWTVLCFAHLMNSPLEIIIHPEEDKHLPVINTEIYDKPAKFSLRCANIVAAKYCTNYSGGGEEQLRWILEFMKKYNVEYSIKKVGEMEGFEGNREEVTAFYEFASYAVKVMPNEVFSIYLRNILKSNH